jgi:hypothetical protein
VNKLVLGLDPGASTGTALVFVGPVAPFRLLRSAVVPDDKLYELLTEIRASLAVDLVAIEGYEIHHKRGLRGHGYAAAAYGYTLGLVSAVFPDTPCVIIKRTDVLSGLGLSRTASKRCCRETVMGLVNTRGQVPDLHVADAIATAIIGSGREP